jgi:proprotein convertase subtilisin/kexin type 5
MAQCPNNYYNDPVITFNYYYCTQCTSGCLTCTGPGLNSCQTCQNATINGSIVSYFKNPTESICQTACITGYYGNVLDNRCDLCQTGCLTCVVNASNCFSCHSDGGNDYFKANASNRCVTICPSGYYGNSSDYTCHDCIYYTLNGSCILTCPSGTFAQSVGNKSICQDCNATNVTGNPCNRSYSFQVQTTVGSNGNSLVHKVLLNGGLSSNITAAQLN